MKLKSFTRFSRALSGLRIKARHHAPEIMVGVAIVSGVAATISACVATTKAPEVIEDLRDDLSEIHEEQNTMELTEATQKAIRERTAAVYFRAAKRLTVLYLPSIMLGTTSISCTLGATNIWVKRNAALAAAYTAVQQQFNDYRDRARERLGSEVEHDIYCGINGPSGDIVETLEDGTTVVTHENKPRDKTTNPDSRFFDESCARWSKNATLNRDFVISTINYLNDLLVRRGYVYLNDFYEAFGFQLTADGSVRGWVYDENSKKCQNKIDIGLYDIDDAAARAFVNGYERNFLMDIRPDGIVHDLWVEMDKREAAIKATKNRRAMAPNW